MLITKLREKQQESKSRRKEIFTEKTKRSRKNLEMTLWPLANLLMLAAKRMTKPRIKTMLQMTKIKKMMQMTRRRKKKLKNKNISMQMERKSI
jgi:hypothetical protein